MGSFEGEVRPAGSVEVRRYTAAEMAEKERAAARLADLTGGATRFWVTARLDDDGLVVNVCGQVPWHGELTETVQVPVAADERAVREIAAAMHDLLGTYQATVLKRVRLAAARTLIRAVDAGDVEL